MWWRFRGVSHRVKAHPICGFTSAQRLGSSEHHEYSNFFLVAWRVSWSFMMTRRCVEGGQPRTWLLCALHTMAPGSSLGSGVDTGLARLHNEA